MATSPQNRTPEACLLAILSLAMEADIKSLTRTELVKYLYLLDVYVAEETSGTTWTEVEWQFYHYGPYATAVASSLDGLVNKSFVQEVPIQSNTKDGFLYSLSDWKSTNSFEGFDELPKGAVIKLKQAIRDFDKQLPKLLNFVYFKTEPMSVARPGEVLDFSMCRKFEISSVKPIAMKPINREKAKLLKQKHAESIAKKNEKLSQIVWGGEYDEVYFQALAEPEGHPLELGLRGRATIAV